MRTDTRARRAIALLAFVALGAAAFAQEFGFDARLGNIQFPWASTTAITDSVFPSSNYFWGGDAWIDAPLGEDASLRFSYERDPVLRNIAIGAVKFERGIASISVGPLVGFLNSDATPFSMGMSAALRLQWPGVAYVSVRSDGGTAISLLQSDIEPQARTEFAVGFYVPHAIVSGVIKASRFSELDASGKSVTDSLTSYAMTFDVFKKNIPYTALFSIGYDLRSKYYAAAATTDSLGAIMLGVDASAQATKDIKVTGSISTGAYVFGLNALSGKGPASSDFLFDAKLGMVVQFEAFKTLLQHPTNEAQKTEAAAEAAPADGQKNVAAEDAAKKEDKPAAVQEESAKALNLKFSIASGVGLYYDAYPLSGTTIDFFSVISNLRGGLWADLMLPVTSDLTVGPEMGLYYIAGSSNFFDLPVNVKLAYSLGAVCIEGFGGFFSSISTATASVTDFAFGLDVGTRVRFDHIYAEGSYVFGLGGAQSFPRLGVGYTMDLKK
jgi:hypothetical protein